MSQGFMMAAELTTYCLPNNLASATLTEGYVVAFVAFYERGINVSSYRFLLLLLQYYSLELHNLTPLGDLVHHGLCDSMRGLHGD
jgi:hypothetical protein